MTGITEIQSHAVHQLKDLQQVFQSVNPDDRSKQILLFNGHEMVQLQPFTWSSMLALKSKEMVTTARTLVELAQTQFMNTLYQRFIGPSVQMGSEIIFPGIPSSTMASAKDPIDLDKLRVLSKNMVERTAHIYGLHPDDIAVHSEALLVENIEKFVQRILLESSQVEAFYLGESNLHQKYMTLREEEKCAQKTVDFLNELALEDCHLHSPLVQDPRSGDYAEVMPMEILAADVVYQLPLITADEVEKLHFDIFIHGHGVVRYKTTTPIDLWSGLIAYRFTPETQQAGTSPSKLPPEILAVRGTQRQTNLSGFLGSMISVWHPQGPGANALKTKQVDELEKEMAGSSHDWILAGHSMGGEIAAAMSKRPLIKDKVLRVYSFSNPGRNKYHSSPDKSINHHHFVGFLDPIVQLGRSRDGNVTLVLGAEQGKPQNMFQMLNHVVDDLRSHHCVPQFLGNAQWIATKMPEDGPVAAYTPIFALIQRFISHHFYGPWKMVALLARAIWPTIQTFAKTMVDRAKKYVQEWKGTCQFSINFEAKNPSTTSSMVLESKGSPVPSPVVVTA